MCYMMVAYAGKIMRVVLTSIFLLTLFSMTSYAFTVHHLSVEASILKPEKIETQEQGVFLGEVITKWLDDKSADRKMELMADFSFIDYQSVKWRVPQGWIFDGASIPKAFWSVVGSPFVGNYRKASVIHDYYCDVRTAHWRQVHRMFYEASLAAGVGKVKAKTLFAIVYAKGPRWEYDGEKVSNTADHLAHANAKNQGFNDLLEWVKIQNPSREQIEKRIDKL